jgi:hypothetical protein
MDTFYTVSATAGASTLGIWRRRQELRHDCREAAKQRARLPHMLNEVVVGTLQLKFPLIQRRLECL